MTRAFSVGGKVLWLKFFPVVKRAILQAKVWLRTVDVKPALSEEHL